MRIVADAAIFRDRLVAAYERTPLFHVAFVADLVDAVLFQVRGSRGTVRIVTVGTAHRCPADPLSNNLANGRRIHLGAGIVVTDGTIRTMQGINVCVTCQGSGAAWPDRGGIAGVTITTLSKNDTVVMSRVRLMEYGTVGMAGITSDVRLGRFDP